MMTTEATAHWPRPDWHPMPGADAQLVYFVFGTFPEKLGLALPDGVVARRHRQLDLRAWDGYPLQRDRLRTWAEADPALAARARAAPEALRIAGTVTDPPSLDYLRVTLRSIARLCNAGAVAVADPLLTKLHAGPDWVREVASGNRVTLRQHYAVISGTDAGRGAGFESIHTRGLAKFGRPDLRISGVPEALRVQGGATCQQLADMQALGGHLREGQVIGIKGLGALRVTARTAASAATWSNAVMELVWPGE